MLCAEELKAFAESLGISASGVCDANMDAVLYEQLKKRRSEFSFCEFEAEDLMLRTDPKKLMEEAQSIFVCLFPYFRSDLPKGNISDYAKVTDYHRVVRLYLDRISQFVKEKEPTAKTKILCDTGPLADRRLAYRAGLGFYGKNNLLIHPVYGSYFFIGSLLLNVPLAADSPMESACAGCNTCLGACPGQALSENYGYDYTKCISYITQAKEISEGQRALLEKQDSVYGCDRCQSVCPHNRNVPDTTIREFYAPPIISLDKEELLSLSGREFKKKYGSYAFSWCKKQTILKNFTEHEPR